MWNHQCAKRWNWIPKELLQFFQDMFTSLPLIVQQMEFDPFHPCLEFDAKKNPDADICWTVTPFRPRWRPFLWPFATEGPLSQNHWTCQANLGGRILSVGGWRLEVGGTKLVGSFTAKHQLFGCFSLGVAGWLWVVFVLREILGIQLGNLGYWLELPTKTQDSSHHQDSIFSRESQPKPSFVTVILGGRPKVLIYQLRFPGFHRPQPPILGARINFPIRKKGQQTPKLEV